VSFILEDCKGEGSTSARESGGDIVIGAEQKKSMVTIKKKGSTGKHEHIRTER